MQKTFIIVFLGEDNIAALYLRLMMLIRILFWFIVFYSLFKLLIRVVLPLVINKVVREKVKDIRENMNTFEGQPPPSDANTANFTKKQTSTPSKGDYIDFEEVK